MRGLEGQAVLTGKVEYDKDANITCTAQPQDGGSTAFTDGLILTDTYFHLSGETQITGVTLQGGSGQGFGGCRGFRPMC